jgi:hypothetical protein
MSSSGRSVSPLPCTPRSKPWKNERTCLRWEIRALCLPRRRSETFSIFAWVTRWSGICSQHDLFHIVAPSPPLLPRSRERGVKHSLSNLSPSLARRNALCTGRYISPRPSDPGARGTSCKNLRACLAEMRWEVAHVAVFCPSLTSVKWEAAEWFSRLSVNMSMRRSTAVEVLVPVLQRGRDSKC